MKVSSIVLTDQNNAIGKNHIILRYLPAFVQYFRELTENAPIIVGQRTFENICHIMGRRRYIVISRNEKYHSSRARTYPSFAEALKDCRKKEKQVFILGASELFRMALPHTSEIYRACITAKIRSQEYYPEIDTNAFDLRSAECIHADQKNRFDYCIEKWVRKKQD